MKKNLLLVISMGIGLSCFAQKQMIPKKQDVSNAKLNRQDGFNFMAVGQQKPIRPAGQGGSNRAVTKIPFTGSRNAFGLIVSESNCLTANQQLNAVMFTHRISNEFNPPNVNSGFIQNTFTTDFGVTWDSLVQTSDGINLCRYPSGAIFNPAGNTNINNAFATISGPITSGSGWIGNYFSYAKLDSTNITPVFAIDGAAGVVNQGFARIGATATDIHTVVTGGLYTDPNGADAAAQGYRGATLNYAKPGIGDTLIWTIDSIIPYLLPDAAGTLETYTTAQTAWNKAGNIGYVVFNGVDSAATGSAAGYVPVVYKTTDAGVTWNKLPLFDFTSISVIANILQPTTGGGAPKAWFSQSKGYDVAVDEDGELHVFCTVESGYSNNIDSLGYTYSYAAAATAKTFYMFDTHTTANGWDAALVDSLNTDNAVEYSQFIDGTDGAAWEIDARMQMSRSDDGSKLFYYWCDSYPSIDIQLQNVWPNIYGKGYDVTNNKWTATKKFTEDSVNYFMYVSNITLQSGTLYKTPVTVSLPVDWPNSADVLNPMRHYFVSGIEFDQNEFIYDNINEVAASKGLVIGDAVPNPFDHETTININLDAAKRVTVDIFNTMGAKVASFDKGMLNAGQSRIVIDGSLLTDGMYFCTITAGAQRATKKLTVKK